MRTFLPKSVSKAHHGRVDPERGQLVAVGVEERLERELARRVGAHDREDHAPQARRDVDQEPPTLRAHPRQDRARQAVRHDHVHAQLLLELLGRERLGDADDAHAGVVDEHADRTGDAARLFDGGPDRGVAQQVDLDGVDVQALVRGEPPELFGGGGVAAAHVAHGGEHGVALARDGLDDQAAEAAVGAGDEDDLVRGAVVAHCRSSPCDAPVRAAPSMRDLPSPRKTVRAPRTAGAPAYARRGLLFS
jgi:hypothetical protein